MRYTIHILIYLWVIIITSACNNSIFLDRPEMPDYSYATVAGDGGSISFDISTTGLLHISFDLYSYSNKYCTFYNSKGDVIPADSPASILGSIVFENQYVKYYLVKNGNKITFTSVENTGSEHHITLRLEYDYAVKFIEFEIERGAQMEQVSVELGELHINDHAETHSQWLTFENGGPITQTFDWYPYLNSNASTVVETDDDWIRGNLVTIPLPVYNGSKWELTDNSSLRIGARYTYKRPDYKTPVPIEVPPFTQLTIKSDVIFSSCTVDGSLIFRNPVSKRLHNARFRCIALYPVNSKITIEDAN